MVKKFLFFFLSICLFWLATVAQNKATRLFEYKPAPGQYINTTEFGTPAAALNMLSGNNQSVSLGALGGYIVLGFEKPCQNDPQNPYGVDFTIFGNAFDGSSEPGIISVMSDTNGNGKPDDTWYEIAGSHHFHPGTVKNTGIRFYKTSTRDVKWKSSSGTSGILASNSYHTQDYYPLAVNFPGYPPDSVFFTSTWVTAEKKINSLGILKTVPPVFGYADCRLQKNGTGPDNPYTPDAVEGYGGDPVDISWAADSFGNYVDLASIDFVRISTGCLNSLGSLGEISTEISAVLDVDPVPGTIGKEDLSIVYSMPDGLLKNDSIPVVSAFFQKGRRVFVPMVFESSDASVGKVVNGKLFAMKQGSFTLKVYPEGHPQDYSARTIVVTEPMSVKILNDFSFLAPGDTIPVQVEVSDNLGNVIPEITYNLITSDPVKAKILTNNNQNKIIALLSGTVSITVKIPGYPLSVSRELTIREKPDQVTVWLTIKNDQENLYPLQKTTVGVASLNSFTDNRKGDYSSRSFPALADAISSGLTKAGAALRFRENNPDGGNLFLYSVEKDGIFTYGWGGKTDPPAYARAWMVRVNGKQYYAGFESVPVKQGDTIFVYHVASLLNDWDLSLLLPVTFKAGNELTIHALKITCRFINQVVTESLPAVVPNLAIQVESGTKKLVYYSDDSGEVKMIPENSNQVFIESKNDAILLTEFSTFNPILEINTQPILYPNPASDFICIENIQPGKHWTLINTCGNAVCSGITENSRLVIPVGFAPSGAFFLKIEGTPVLKFVKR